MTLRPWGTLPPGALLLCADSVELHLCVAYLRSFFATLLLLNGILLALNMLFFEIRGLIGLKVLMMRAPWRGIFLATAALCRWREIVIQGRFWEVPPWSSAPLRELG